MSNLRPYHWHTENTLFYDWFERDRQNVRLENHRGELILELWDEEVTQFVEDGFKSRREDWHDALCKYATENKLRARRGTA